jgi:hypothetical protein
MIFRTGAGLRRQRTVATRSTAQPFQESELNGESGRKAADVTVHFGQCEPGMCVSAALMDLVGFLFPFLLDSN